MLHYPSVIKLGSNSGPFKIRFEAFHKHFKLSAHTIASRLNIAFSLSMKHQFLLCRRFFLSNRGFSEVLVFGAFTKLTNDTRKKELLKHVKYTNFNACCPTG